MTLAASRETSSEGLQASDSASGSTMTGKSEVVAAKYCAGKSYGSMAASDVLRMLAKDCNCSQASTQHGCKSVGGT